MNIDIGPKHVTLGFNTFSLFDRIRIAFEVLKGGSVVVVSPEVRIEVSPPKA